MNNSNVIYINHYNIKKNIFLFMTSHKIHINIFIKPLHISWRMGKDPQMAYLLLSTYHCLGRRITLNYFESLTLNKSAKSTWFPSTWSAWRSEWWTGQWTGWQMGKQTGRWMGWQTGRQTGWQMRRRMGQRMGWWTGWRMGRQTGQQTRWRTGWRIGWRTGWRMGKWSGWWAAWVAATTTRLEMKELVKIRVILLNSAEEKTNDVILTLVSSQKYREIKKKYKCPTSVIDLFINFWLFFNCLYILK